MILRLIVCILSFAACVLCAIEKTNLKSDWILHKPSQKEFLVVRGFFVNYHEAKLMCETQFSQAFNDNRTTLATINSWDEQRFVYSLALRSSALLMGPIHFWIGARKVGNSTLWVDEKSYRNAFQEEITDEEKYENMFNSSCFDNCSVDDKLCGRLDLSRFVIGGEITRTNPWIFFDCGYFTGFICQHRRKVSP